MIDGYIKDYIRIISSVSLPQVEKDRIADCLIQKRDAKKELTSKHFAAASAVAVLAISTVLIARGMKQDINIM